MENKGKMGDLEEILFDSEIREIAVKYLTKKELAKYDTQIKEILLESFEKPSNKTIGEIIESLVKKRIKSLKNSDTEYWCLILYKMYYESLFEKFKKEKGGEEAKIILRNWTKKRFKSPNDFKKFIKEIKLLQENYPKILKVKQDRDRIRKQFKDVPIYITNKLAKDVFGIYKPTKKDSASIRKKIERAKKDGFL